MKKATKAATITHGQYTFERIENGWYRRDLNSEYPNDKCRATGWDDASPRYGHGEGHNYNQQCSGCYLGHAHTTDMHFLSIEMYNRK